MAFEDGMSGSRGDADLKPIGYYTDIDDLVRVLEEKEVEVSRKNCRANADFSQLNYTCVERAENRWPNCPFYVLVVQDDFGNFSVYSSGEHVHVGESCKSDELGKESDVRGSVLSEIDVYVGSLLTESHGNGLAEACESSEAIVSSQETNARLNADITGPQVDKIHQRCPPLVGISRNVPASSPAPSSGTAALLLSTEGQSSSQINNRDYDLFAKCNSNSEVNPILLRNHVMYSHQSSTDRTYWKCGRLTHKSAVPNSNRKTHVGSGRLAKGCDFSILQQTNPDGKILLYNSGEHNREAHESLPSQSTSAASNSGSSEQGLKRVRAASSSRPSHVRQSPSSAFPTSQRPVGHKDDSTFQLKASPQSTPLPTVPKRIQEGRTLAEVKQFLSERRLCWSSTFDDGATRIYSCRTSKCPNEVEIKLVSGKYTVEERGEHHHPAPESPANDTRRSTCFNHPDRNECEEVPNTEDIGPAGSIEQRLSSTELSLNCGTTSSRKQPNSVNDETTDGDAGSISLDMHEVNSAHPNEAAPVEEEVEQISVLQGPVSEAGAEVQNDNQPPEVVILSSDEEKSGDHGSDSDLSSTTTASIDEEIQQHATPTAEVEDSVENFHLSDKLPEIEEMAESMGLEIVDEGDTVMVMASRESPGTAGKRLILKDGDEVEVAEFVKRVFVRKQNWVKRGWNEFRIQLHERCADHFMNNDK